MRTFWLSTHLDYACRHSGACCTARWPIPVERDRAAMIASAIPVRLEWLRPAPDAPAGVAGILALQASGACVFHEPRAVRPGGCAVHAARPVSCEHFPYVTVTDPRGTHVTLSHFCPTAADLLFDDTPVAVVEGPPLFADGRAPEGLDAREALPPIAEDPPPPATPRLMTWDDVTRWERELIERLAAERGVPPDPCLDAFAEARAATAGEWTWPAPLPDAQAAWRRWVAPGWERVAPVVGRYLAAKVHGSWAMCLGAGTREVERMVHIARNVLQVEAARICSADGEPLDRARLHAAIRQSDLLLMHHAVPERLYSSALHRRHGAR